MRMFALAKARNTLSTQLAVKPMKESDDMRSSERQREVRRRQDFTLVLYVSSCQLNDVPGHRTELHPSRSPLLIFPSFLESIGCN